MQAERSGSEGRPALHASPVAALGPRGSSLSGWFGPAWGPVLAPWACVLEAVLMDGPAAFLQ